MRTAEGLTLTKPDAGQAFQAGSFLLCVYLAIQLTRGLDGTEFSGGWLTGPLLSIADIGAVFFIIGLALTFFVPRIAALLGLASSLLCVPLCCFFIAPVPFAQVFARGHEFKVYPAPMASCHLARRRTPLLPVHSEVRSQSESTPCASGNLRANFC